MIFTTCYIQRDNILVKIRQVCQEIEISQIIRKMITHNIIKIRSRKITRDSQSREQKRNESAFPLFVCFHPSMCVIHTLEFTKRESVISRHQEEA